MKVNTDGIMLGAWVECGEAKKILDIGTGNGLIALMIAQKSLEAKIYGVEIDEDSFLDAKLNFENSKFFERLVPVLSSIQNFSKKCDFKFDHIVSNPPFFSGGTFSTNENKTNVRHTVKLPHGDLLIAVNNLLEQGGLFSVVLPMMEGMRFSELAQRTGLYEYRKCTVFTRENNPPERLLITFLKQKKELLTSSELIIHKGETNDYSQDYIDLTKDYYIKF